MLGVIKTSRGRYSFIRSDREGQALALRYGGAGLAPRTGNSAFPVGRGPVPRRARDDWKPRGGQIFLFIVGSRGTGPRATVLGGVSRVRDRKRYLHRRAGACPPPCLGRSKTFAMAVFFYRRFARDRPSRYGIEERFSFIVGSRGTGPRATARGGSSTGQKTPSATVGRGPVPRHAWGDPTL